MLRSLRRSISLPLLAHSREILHCVGLRPDTEQDAHAAIIAGGGIATI